MIYRHIYSAIDFFKCLCYIKNMADVKHIKQTRKPSELERFQLSFEYDMSIAEVRKQYKK